MTAGSLFDGADDDKGLAGKVAVVTGAGQGIGLEIARALARSGARVALAARDRGKLDDAAATLERTGGSPLVVPTDLRSPDEVDALATATERELGTPDVLVNNSGVAGPTAELWKVAPSEWDQTLRVNLTGVYLVCRAFLPAMIRRGSGSVVVIGSVTGKRPLYGRTPYAASKLGLVGLVRTLATEAGPHGIRVNLVSPGAVEGPRLDAVIRAQAEANGRSDEDVTAQLRGASPLGRFVAPRDVADMVVFLASDAASSITGEDINVASGQVMY